MKKIFTLATFAVLAFAVSSCSFGFSVNDLSSINVGDAKMIFKMDSSTRSSGGTGYWKIDEDGNEVELQIYNKNGKSVESNILSITKLSDDLLLLYIDISNNGTIYYTGIGDRVLFLVNTKDERLFFIPDSNSELCWLLHSFSYKDNPEDYIKEDGDGNLYISTSLNSSYQIIKLDITDYSMGFVLPSDDYFDKFFVNNEGFVGWGNSNNNTTKVKCPGGRTIPLESTQSLFSLNGEFYIYDFDAKAIFSYKSNGNNDMQMEFICDFDSWLSNGYSYIRESIENSSRGTVILGYTDSGIVEFDGSTTTTIDMERDNNPYSFTLKASNARYMFGNSSSTLSKIDMKTYEVSEIELPKTEYCFLNSHASSLAEGIRFSGYKYLDSSGIRCSIDANDNIAIESVFSNVNSVVSLIEIF